VPAYQLIARIKKEGIEEGEERGKKEIAKEMIKNGESIEKIIKYTKLSKEEIAKI